MIIEKQIQKQKKELDYEKSIHEYYAIGIVAIHGDDAIDGSYHRGLMA